MVHNIRRFTTALFGLALFSLPLAAFAAGNTPAGGYSLVFDQTKFTVKTSTLNGKTFSYRAYEGIVYVKNPVDLQYQTLNIYVPTEFYEGKSVGLYTAETAPIFFPNTVGGYMPGAAKAPGLGMDGKPDASTMALSRGLVVVSPGARGRTLVDPAGLYTGKAPAAIVDLKAAVRYLRANDKLIPGNAEKIITNGTSAGGALSSLVGATGNNAEYEPYLKALGAADARDDVFATSAYCPITNLDNADMAYEWLLAGVNESKTFGRGAPPAGAGAPGTPAGAAPGVPANAPTTSAGPMSDVQIKNSATLKAQFPAYVNSLGLKDAQGKALTLDANGNGPFKDYVKSVLIAAAQKALKEGADLSKLTWVTVKNGTVTDLDWDQWVTTVGRMKKTSAFDGTDLGTGENNLFGTATVNNQHFTAFGAEKSTVAATTADPAIVKLMNPMAYIGTKGTTTAKFWRIRHGSSDRDTSPAISAILAAKLANSGSVVDYALPWGVPHSGDYDQNELFAWIDQISK